MNDIEYNGSTHSFFFFFIVAIAAVDSNCVGSFNYFYALITAPGELTLKCTRVFADVIYYAWIFFSPLHSDPCMFVQVVQLFSEGLVCIPRREDFVNTNRSRHSDNTLKVLSVWPSDKKLMLDLMMIILLTIIYYSSIIVI